MKIRERLFHFILVLSIVISNAPMSGGQSNVSGAARGYVFEMEGNDNRKPIVGAEVFIKNRETGLIRAAVTQSDGSYYVSGLPSGLYDISATKKRL